MKSYLKIIAILFFSALISLCLTPLISGFLPFHPYKIMSRAAAVSVFILLICMKRYLGFRSVKELGIEFNKRFFRLSISGFMLGLVSMAVVLGFMLKSNIRFAVPDALSMHSAEKFTGYIFTGIAVGFFEEFLFRGLILQSMLKDTNVFSSILTVNIFYSVVHFFKPAEAGRPEVFNLAGGIHALPLFFRPVIAGLPHIWPSIFGLFLVGTALSVMYIRFRTLSVSIGLHAGWVLGVLSISLFTDVSHTSNSLFLNGRVIGNAVTWCILLMFILAGLWGIRRRKSQNGLEGRHRL